MFNIRRLALLCCCLRMRQVGIKLGVVFCLGQAAAAPPPALLPWRRTRRQDQSASPPPLGSLRGCVIGSNDSCLDKNAAAAGAARPGERRQPGAKKASHSRAKHDDDATTKTRKAPRPPRLPPHTHR